MTEMLTVENMKSIANGKASMPEVDEQGMIVLNSSEPQGSFSSPIHEFGKNSFRYELNLPENIGKLVGSGELVVSVETKGNWSYFLPKNKTHLYKMKMNQSAAEGFCAKQGGHLASVESVEKEDSMGMSKLTHPAGNILVFKRNPKKDQLILRRFIGPRVQNFSR